MALGRRRTGDTRWERHWVAGLSVRAAVTLVPFALSVATIIVAGRLLPRPKGSGIVVWYAAICAGSWAVMWLSHRGLHRFLPLAGLLEMSLLFPERAPSRLRLARRVASRKDLEDLRSGRGVGHHESTQQAAERILALVSALSEHDRATRGHSERVRALTDLLAVRIGLTQHDRDRLRWAALLHDIGKLKVPTGILNKPARPSPGEWQVLRRHPHDGEEMIAPLLGWLGEWGSVVVQHHEKWDGSGYPQGLSGTRIGLGARIVTVADAYDVMTAARAYKKPMGRNAALRELVAGSGSHFDPDVVRALIATPQRQVLLTMGPISWLTGLPFVGQAPSALSAALTSQTTIAAGAVALTGTATFVSLAPAASTTPTPTPHHTPTARTAHPTARATRRSTGTHAPHTARTATRGLTTGPDAAHVPAAETLPSVSGPATAPNDAPTGGDGPTTVPTSTPVGTEAPSSSTVPADPTTGPTTAPTSAPAAPTSTAPSRREGHGNRWHHGTGSKGATNSGNSSRGSGNSSGGSGNGTSGKSSGHPPSG